MAYPVSLKDALAQASVDLASAEASADVGNVYQLLADYFAEKACERPQKASKKKVEMPMPANAGPPKGALSMASAFTLSSGHSMPMLGYGTFRSAPGEVRSALYEAIKAGYRHLDLAHVYGNEKEVGGALKQAFDEGLVKREDLFLTGKLWNSDHEAEVVPKACDQSLNDIGVDYLDLYLIHFPVAVTFTGLETPGIANVTFGKTPLIETWRAMEELVRLGKARSIGVSNFPLCLMNDIVNMATIRPAVNQIEAHPYYVRDSLVNYCLSRNIAVTAHTPLGGAAANASQWNTPNPLDHDVIKGIASEVKKSPAQVILRWLLQRNIQVIPKSVKPERMQQNMDVFNFELSTEQMQKISGLDMYKTAKTNPNPLSHFIGAADCFSKDGTDIFD